MGNPGSWPGLGRIPKYVFFNGFELMVQMDTITNTEILKISFSFKKVLRYNSYTIKANTLTYYHLQIFDKCIPWCKWHHNKNVENVSSFKNAPLGYLPSDSFLHSYILATTDIFLCQQLCHFQKSIDIKSYNMQPSVSGFSHLHS